MSNLSETIPKKIADTSYNNNRNITQEQFERFLKDKKIDVSNKENTASLFESFLVFQGFMNGNAVNKDEVSLGNEEDLINVGTDLYNKDLIDTISYNGGKMSGLKVNNHNTHSMGKRMFRNPIIRKKLNVKTIENEKTDNGVMALSNCRAYNNVDCINTRNDIDLIVSEEECYTYKVRTINFEDFNKGRRYFKCRYRNKSESSRMPSGCVKRNFYGLNKEMIYNKKVRSLENSRQTDINRESKITSGTFIDKNDNKTKENNIKLIKGNILNYNDERPIHGSPSKSFEDLVKEKLELYNKENNDRICSDINKKNKKNENTGNEGNFNKEKCNSKNKSVFPGKKIERKKSDFNKEISEKNKEEKGEKQEKSSVKNHKKVEEYKRMRQKIRSEALEMRKEYKNGYQEYNNRYNNGCRNNYLIEKNSCCNNRKNRDSENYEVNSLEYNKSKNRNRSNGRKEINKGKEMYIKNNSVSNSNSNNYNNYNSSNNSNKNSQNLKENYNETNNDFDKKMVKEAPDKNISSKITEDYLNNDNYIINNIISTKLPQENTPETNISITKVPNLSLNNPNNNHSNKNTTDKTSTNNNKIPSKIINNFNRNYISSNFYNSKRPSKEKPDKNLRSLPEKDLLKLKKYPYNPVDHINYLNIEKLDKDFGVQKKDSAKKINNIETRGRNDVESRYISSKQNVNEVDNCECGCNDNSKINNDSSVYKNKRKNIGGGLKNNCCNFENNSQHYYNRSSYKDKIFNNNSCSNYDILRDNSFRKYNNTIEHSSNIILNNRHNTLNNHDSDKANSNHIFLSKHNQTLNNNNIISNNSPNNNFHNNKNPTFYNVENSSNNTKSDFENCTNSTSSVSINHINCLIDIKTMKELNKTKRKSALNQYMNNYKKEVKNSGNCLWRSCCCKGEKESEFDLKERGGKSNSNKSLRFCGSDNVNNTGNYKDNYNECKKRIDVDVCDPCTPEFNDSNNTKINFSKLKDEFYSKNKENNIKIIDETETEIDEQIIINNSSVSYMSDNTPKKSITNTKNNSFVNINNILNNNSSTIQENYGVSETAQEINTNINNNNNNSSNVINEINYEREINDLLNSVQKNNLNKNVVQRLKGVLTKSNQNTKLETMNKYFNALKANEKSQLIALYETNEKDIENLEKQINLLKEQIKAKNNINKSIEEKLKLANSNI